MSCVSVGSADGGAAHVNSGSRLQQRRQSGSVRLRLHKPSWDWTPIELFKRDPVRVARRWQIQEHQDNGLLPTVVEFSSSASDVNGDGLLDLYIAEGLPFGNNVELIGQFTSKLYINKVRSKNHGIPSMDRYVAICCWCQQCLAMRFDRAPGATHGDSLQPPAELRTEEWLATNC